MDYDSRHTLITPQNKPEIPVNYNWLERYFAYLNSTPEVYWFKRFEDVN
jgi:hypothetical protein